MVMLGRPLLADPEWCNKAYEGRVEDICPCIGCQEGCVNEFVEGGHIQCAVNARTGFEDSLPERGPAPEKKKKSPWWAADRLALSLPFRPPGGAHTVELLEKSDKLGGRVVPGSVPAVKFDFKNYLAWLNEQVRQAQQLPNFTLRLSTPVTTQWLAEQKFDTIVFAVGTRDACPPIPGLDKVKAVQAVDLLVNPGLLGDA